MKFSFIVILCLYCEMAMGYSALSLSNIDRILHKARYMSEDCRPFSYPGWEKFEVNKCKYTVTDKNGVAKTGLVVVANPNAEKLRAWILSACKNVRPQKDLTKCSNQVFNQIVFQSGAQFPIAGIVYEDIIKEDGVYEAYAFSNGVTVKIPGIKHRRTEKFTIEELEAILEKQPIKTVSDSAYARIIGVSRSEYKNVNFGQSIEGLDWPKVVALEYKKALECDRNSLIEAWLAAH